MISVSKQQMKCNHRNVRNRSETSKPTISRNEILGGTKRNNTTETTETSKTKRQSWKPCENFDYDHSVQLEISFSHLLRKLNKQINLKHIFRLFSPDVTDFPALKSWVVSVLFDRLPHLRKY